MTVAVVENSLDQCMVKSYDEMTSNELRTEIENLTKAIDAFSNRGGVYTSFCNLLRADLHTAEMRLSDLTK